MELSHLIGDLQACVGDSEWERAGTYFDDLRRELRELLATPLGARNAGAITTTLRGIEVALAERNGPRAAAALRHLAYFVDERTRPSLDAGG